MSVFQDLYHSEINFSVSTFWDGGFEVKLGDEMNGFVAEATFDRFGQIEAWLTAEAIKAYPDSLFAKMYRDGLSVWFTHLGDSAQLARHIHVRGDNGDACADCGRDLRDAVHLRSSEVA